MSQSLLISGPPGCGKTTWIRNQIQSHRGPCGFLRLAGYPDEALLQAVDQLSVIPGRLGLHQDCGGLLARQVLESEASLG